YSLLESTSLAERVARDLDLASDVEFLEAFGLEGEKELAAASSRLAVQRVGEVLLENLTVSPVRGSSLVDVSFASPSPSLSARVVEVWVEQFIQASIERQFAATNDAREFLEQQLGQLRQRLEDS